MNDQKSPGARAASDASPRRSSLNVASLALATLLIGTAPLSAAPFYFSTGGPYNEVATASGTVDGLHELETADDFVVTDKTKLTTATFLGLIPYGALTSDITTMGVEIYRVFPGDSDTTRTSLVPTRTNSPADAALYNATSVPFTVTELTATSNAQNSVVSGINPPPNQFTGGEGFVSGPQISVEVDFSSPLVLDPGHYFIVPLVDISSSAGGPFLWLSGARPIGGSLSTPFAPDFQSWIRADNIQPDWLRVGTDIVGSGHTYNAAFTLGGVTVPASVPDHSGSTAGLCAFGLGAIGWIRRRAQR